MDFSQAVRAQLRGEIVRVSQLVEFYFLSGTIRLWRGDWPLTTSDSKTWTPTLGLGKISGLAQSYGEAQQMKLSVSGVDSTFAARAYGEKTEWYNRLVFIWEQFFDESWQPLDSPYCIRWGHMRELTSRKKPHEIGGYLYEIEISAETPFDGRANAPYAYLNDTDQRARHPTPVPDTALSRAGGLEARRIDHPQF